MKNFRTFIIFSTLAIVASACDKLDVKKVDFEVATDKVQYKVGDSVNFVFSGNPDNITFYSGEPGFRYAFKDRTIATGKPQLTFTSYGMPRGTQQNTLFLYASTDFNGTVDNANISAATWTDITSRANLTPNIDNNPSGVIDLSDVVLTGKPLYLAFKFVGYGGSAQRTWIIKSFNVKNILENEPESVITDITKAGWLFTSFSGDLKWQVPNGSALIQFVGPQGSPANAVPNEDWIVTKPLYVDRVTPDRGIPLKNMMRRMDGYSYIFQEPGTYDITFVASNVNVKESDSVVRHLSIEVVE